MHAIVRNRRQQIPLPAVFEELRERIRERIELACVATPFLMQVDLLPKNARELIGVFNESILRIALRINFVFVFAILYEPLRVLFADFALELASEHPDAVL